ncbi:MAG: hypothetical protein HY681_13030 [Chloroflexi bacterium]|nr:hypothetical protein [Chloroflexota bacterium]
MWNQIVASLLGTKHVALAIGVFAAAVTAGAAFGAGLLVSNILNVGTTTFVSYSIELTQIKSLDASLGPGQTGSARFGIRNTGSALPSATLMVELVGGVNLADASIVTMEFEDRNTSDKWPVTLSAVGGTLQGKARSGWAVPVGYAGEADVKVTFRNGAPITSYTLNIWIEMDAAAPAPTPTPTAAPGAPTPTPSATALLTMDVTATKSDTFVPGSVTIGSGSTVRWTMAADAVHNVFFDDPAIPDSPSVLTSGQTYQATFSQTGSYTYYCSIHGRDMSGTVIVQ